MRSKKPIFKRKACSADNRRKRKKVERQGKDLSFCSSLLRQSSVIVDKILRSSNKGRGVNIKALTLADHIQSKKAVHAVVCQTLKSEPPLASETQLFSADLSILKSLSQRLKPAQKNLLQARKNSDLSTSNWACRICRMGSFTF